MSEYSRSHDRYDAASTIATIGASSATRGSYSQLASGDLLASLGPRSLTVKNSLEKASISISEEYLPWAGRAPSLKYLIPMRDDYQWVMEADDYRELYYTGFSGDGTAEGTITLANIGAAIEDNLYYMYLKRAALVPIGLPRTSIAEDFGEGQYGSKRAGFLDSDDYFRYTSSFQYFGEKGGISDPSQGITSVANAINWEYLGTINQTDTDTSSAGSWNTFIDTYYLGMFGALGSDEYAEGFDAYIQAGTIGSQSFQIHTDIENWDDYYTVSNSIVLAHTQAKNLIKVQSTSVTRQSFAGFENVNEYTGTDGYMDTEGIKVGFQETGTQGSTGGVGKAGGLGNPAIKATDDEGFTPGPDGNICPSTIGAFLYEYCGPLYPHGLILEPGGSGVFRRLNDGDGTQYTDAFYTATAPQHSEWASNGDDGSFLASATFSFSGQNMDKSLAIRFESTTQSLGRANAYVDYYTGYLYEKIEHDPIPREYKTKMQATPKLDPKLMSAVVGKMDSSGYSPSESKVSTATTTSDMGSTY